MFGWFRPRPPLETFEQAWVERHMRWLAGQFTVDRIRRADILLPTDESLPPGPPENHDEVRKWLNLIAARLDLDASSIKLEVVDEAAMPGASGQYVQNERLIRINETVLAEPPQLIAVLAHELAHELLLGQGRLENSDPDHEWITDLLPVCFGLGIFSANCTIVDRTHRFGTSETWSIERSGYLPSRMFGYALALFAHLRGEHQPPWMDLLRPDAREPLREGLKYLAKEPDSELIITRDWSSLSDAELLDMLHSAPPSRQLDAVWELEARGVHSPEVLTALRRLFDADDDAVAEQAVHVLSDWPEFPEAARQDIALLTEHRDTRRRIAALRAAARHRFPADPIVSNLQDLFLGELSRRELLSALHCLLDLGRSAEPLLPYVVKVWKTSLVRMDDDELGEAAATVFAACTTNPEQQAESFLPDPELSTRAIEMLRRLKNAPNIALCKSVLAICLADCRPRQSKCRSTRTHGRAICSSPVQASLTTQPQANQS
ncbi:MAG: hypothetical protein DWQ34_10225 [Planctomycetota bacterium]|nr:MAG: hypothetical protein DWQ29_20300 [Planctomycetota bacterium]REJ93599.1 MAG: hypothetical protein DWQ34_10225 [Planctomycetota bacterium]REK19941.1 MAG: hypothetical protein DWQ41_26815 [Planctomycetota bacterium]REK27506.1 MAG: hypothetical protein DWQ45_25830 [Planctomycetota bacterium]